MLALGLGVLLLIVLGAAVRSGVALAGAWALTSLVALPTLVDVLAWLAAGGYALVNVIGAGVAILALLNAGKAQRKVGIQPAPPRRR